jgi:hypothetical protein
MISDYAYLLNQCLETSAPYIFILEDDVILAGGWFVKTMNGLPNCPTGRLLATIHGSTFASSTPKPSLCGRPQILVPKHASGIPLGYGIWMRSFISHSAILAYNTSHH